MMGAGLGMGVDGDRAGPQFLGADAGEIDRGLAVHTGGRRHVGIELIAGNDANAIMLPAFVVPVRMIVGVRMGVVVRAAHLVAFLKNRVPPDGT